MQLSDEIINAFVKTLPNGEKDNSNGYELYYGTVKVSNGKTSVILDGSHVETPLNYLTMGAENGDRVTCIIKDHSLIVTGNLTHPSEGMTTKYIETMTVLAQEAAIGKLVATEGDFTKLTADSAFVKRLMSDQVGASILTADEAFIGSLQTKIVTADKIKAMQAEIGYVDAETLKANYIDAKTIRSTYVDTATLQANYIDANTIRSNYVDAETLKANYVNIKTLEANYIDANTIKANYVDTKTLKANYIDAKTLQANYIDAATIRANYVDINTLHSNYIDANTLKANYVDTKTLKANYMDAATIKAGYLQADMANLKIVKATRASIATLLADIALIKNATISQGHITGALDSVTLNANKITAGSLSVDRLYINGSDGKPRLVKFDASGKPVATTIDASILTDRTVTADKIVANSITANEISTDFITAFRADIMQTVTEHLEAIDAEIQNLISGDTTITSLTVKSNASVGGQLTVTGSTILKGSVTMNSTLNVAGAVTATSLTVKSNASVGGKLTVTGPTILTDPVTTHSSLTVGGAITAKSLTLSTPLPEKSGGTGVNNFNDLFKVFRDRDYRLNYTCTNLINVTAQTQSKNGITLTNNGDGTYAVNGTASEWTFFNLNYVNSSTLSVPVGTYKLTGTPPDNNKGVRTQVMGPDKAFGTDEVGNGIVFTIPQGTTASWVRIAIDKGTTCNNLLFKPMITTDLNATYDNYVQYSGDGELNENVADMYQSLIDKIYPVGSIYTSTKNVSPATFLGGTWTRIKDTFLLAAGDTYSAGTTGGSSTHTLTVDEMPSHTHTFTGSSATTTSQNTSTTSTVSANHTHGFTTGGAGGHSHWQGVSNTGHGSPNSFGISAAANVSGWTQSNLGTSAVGDHTHSGTTGGISANHTHTYAHTHTLTAKGSNSKTGGGKAHSIMPPYKVVYAWERTA